MRKSDSPTEPCRRFGAPGAGSARRRSRGRPAALGVLLAGLVLAAGATLLLPESAQAQTAVTLVTNAGQAGSDSPTANRAAQAFTTGTNELGYTLTGISLHGADFSNSNNNTATLHSGSRTGTKVADFTAAASGTSKLVLTPTEAINLEKETTYFLVTDDDFGSGLWVSTNSDDQDATPAAGWSIADGSELYQSGTMMWRTIATSRQITVTGTVRTPNPTVLSIERHSPTTSPTNADSLTWRVTFSASVKNVDAADFTVSGTTAGLAVSGSAAVWDVTASGGDLAGLDGTVTLGFASGQNIANQSDLALENTTPSGTNDNTYFLDNSGPVLTSVVSGVTGTRMTLTFGETLATPATQSEKMALVVAVAGRLTITADGEPVQWSMPVDS